MAESGNYCAVETIQLSIIIWLITGNKLVFHSNDSKYVLEEPLGKFISSI